MSDRTASGQEISRTRCRRVSGAPWRRGIKRSTETSIGARSRILDDPVPFQRPLAALLHSRADRSPRVRFPVYTPAVVVRDEDPGRGRHETERRTPPAPAGGQAASHEARPRREPDRHPASRLLLRRSARRGAGSGVSASRSWTCGGEKSRRRSRERRRPPSAARSVSGCSGRQAKSRGAGSPTSPCSWRSP